MFFLVFICCLYLNCAKYYLYYIDYIVYSVYALYCLFIILCALHNMDDAYILLVYGNLIVRCTRDIYIHVYIQVS